MSNLLDKASIILTPTAYNNGEALCVKPSDGSGDFQFSRNSAATRVNAQGLVENVQILSSNLVQNGDFSEEGAEEVSNGSFSQEGSELITNGNFSNGSTDWILDSGWSVSDNKALCDGTNLAYITQTAVLTTGKSYKVQFDIVDYTSGSIKYRDNGFVSGQSFSGVGSYTDYVVAGGGQFRLMSENFTGSIDNVSVREVAQDWTLGTGWSIGEDKAIQDGTGSGSSLQQSNILVVDKAYKITYEILERTQGSIQVFAGFPNSNAPSNNTIGVHTHYIKAEGNTNFYLLPSNFIGSITNISVKEVGQNWDLGNWSVGDSLVSSGNTSSLLQQPTIYTNVTSIFKTTFRARSVSGASVSLRLYDGAGFNYETFTITSSDFQDFELTRQRGGTSTTLSFYNNSNAEIEITNISVIEITDDTNLPRINYEGFSYQDVLGSELVTNGDFATDSDWTKNGNVSISGGSANFIDNGSNLYSYIRQNISQINGKKYLIDFEIKNYSFGSLQVILQSSGIANTYNSNGKYSIVVESSVSNGYVEFSRNFDGGTFSFSIDNVSVKEYLGQEVVPDSGCGSWLWESQSTNLITQSQLFSDASWVKANSSVVSGFASPSGNINSYKLIASVSNTDHTIRTASIATAAVGTTVTFSIYIKPQEITKIALVDNWTNLSYGVVNLTTNSVIEEAQGTTSVTEILNGFRRVSFTYQTANINTQPTVYLLDDAYVSGNPTAYTFASDGTSGVYIWGAMLEALSYATSYIPTSGSTVTRNQDLCTNGGSLASINSTSGTLYAEIAALADEGHRYISLSDGTTLNRVTIELYPAPNILVARLTSNNVQQAFLVATNINKENYNKIAIKYKENDCSFWVNGVKVATDTSVVTPIGLSKLSFNDGGASSFFGKTKALAVWKEALSDEELTELTTI